jgi:YesN/AraC family two-component response regulator
VVVRGLRDAGFSEIHEAEDGLAAKEYLTGHTVDVVITDVMMPRLDGLELIRWARQRYPEIVWIIFSSLDTFDAAVEAIHLGAFDFLAKPPNLKELEISLRNALAHRQLVEEKEALHRSLEQRVLQLEGLCRILGDQAEQINQDPGGRRLSKALSCHRCHRQCAAFLFTPFIDRGTLSAAISTM